ncbi:MAG TPA: pyridoxamine 5'-phosphate oxidase family protein [Deltaproteobacteria bacterium]|nr:pyridoxamine 5'-phosphate oxidase family protein [Deltaproteobacteria bacterium]HPR54718.1 pyridoxamine 5'-phosphate oxidase family protein [Deltaproteobacteria bacterium]HXK48273.1 pyridoxamine 5'-phosphate oxidase family protein [Deltaproteobacteria bacterium]
MDFEFKEVKVVDPRQVSLELKALFASQGLAVLSTHEHGQPYCSLVAFSSSEDLKQLVFATTRSTRKFSNIDEDSRVSMLIDNRSNRVSDFHEAMAVTVTGRAEESLGPEKDGLLKLYLAKHPHLEDFVMSPSCALMRLDVLRYYVVSRFQHVMVLAMKE